MELIERMREESSYELSFTCSLRSSKAWNNHKGQQQSQGTAKHGTITRSKIGKASMKLEKKKKE